MDKHGRRAGSETRLRCASAFALLRRDKTARQAGAPIMERSWTGTLEAVQMLRSERMPAEPSCLARVFEFIVFSVG